MSIVHAPHQGTATARATSQLELVSLGGYRFHLPVGVHRARVTLRVPGVAGECVTTPHGSSSFVLDPHHPSGLAGFLSALDARDLWTAGHRTSIECELIVRVDGLVKASYPVTVQPPVAPYSGDLGPDSAGCLGDDKPTRYVGTGEAPFVGRILHKPIAGMRFYKYGGKFTVRVDERGFDCITFVGSVFGAQSHMDAKGDKLAAHLKAASVKHVPDQSHPATVMHYFKHHAGAKDETYLLWSGGHIVLVHLGSVHEFNVRPKNGYNVTDVEAWLGNPHRAHKRFCLRRDPQLA